MLQLRKTPTQTQTAHTQKVSVHRAVFVLDLHTGRMIVQRALFIKSTKLGKYTTITWREYDQCANDADMQTTAVTAIDRILEVKNRKYCRMYNLGSYYSRHIKGVKNHVFFLRSPRRELFGRLQPYCQPLEESPLRQHITPLVSSMSFFPPK